MNPVKPKGPSSPVKPQPGSQSGGVKNKSLKIPDIKSLPAKLVKKYGKHSVFAAVLLVLLVYIFVVFRISSLSKAEPSTQQTGNATSLIPKIDQNAVNQIQSLENNNTQIQSLFEQARTNPFQE